ncbi:MAG: hypothetical protein ACKN9A_06800 [Microcystis aeruginosa]|jgi:hypothetical protein
MIRSEILQEKDKTQTRLSEEYTSIHDYLLKSNIAAKKAAESYGFTLKYAELPNTIFLYLGHNEYRLGKHSSVDVCHGFRNLVYLDFPVDKKP